MAAGLVAGARTLGQSGVKLKDTSRTGALGPGAAPRSEGGADQSLTRRVQGAVTRAALTRAAVNSAALTRREPVVDQNQRSSTCATPSS